jgi:hypothetical protein
MQRLPEQPLSGAQERAAGIMQRPPWQVPAAVSLLALAVHLGLAHWVPFA